MPALRPLSLLLLLGAAMPTPAQDPPTAEAPRPRARDLGLRIGPFEPGPRNAITDVPGVRVGHQTIVAGENVRTGVTVVLPHGGNLFQDKVPAGIHVMNGFGKLAGSTQVHELGELESPIALANTLAVGTVLQELVAWSLAQPGNEPVRSVNCVVGETNDGRLNDIRTPSVRPEHVRAALADAAARPDHAPVPEGCVGAGTGTACLGWKGGIGTSSRRVGAFTLGVLAQTNFGGRLRVDGRELPRPRRQGGDDRDETPQEHGSCMLVIATDAPLCARNLERLAARAFAGMARAGASFSNGSGDYAIAFSTAPELRIRAGQGPTTGGPVLTNEACSPLFAAVADATEEAIVNSLLAAVTTTGNGATLEALPAGRVRDLLGR